MTRTIIPTRDNASKTARPMFDAVYKKLGFVPNVLRLTSLSPNALTALNRMQESLSDSFDVRLRANVALAVSEVNACLYCLAAHTYIGVNFGRVSPSELLFARGGMSSDKKMAAVGRFVKQVIDVRGHIAEVELINMREAGFTDGQILSIIGLSVQFMFTNYINNVFDTKIDFPKVHALDEGSKIREFE
ncbi:carboxymuconolactone decarboxylase family protein [Pseudomonas sp. URMO17WK12:I12]|uniref:carboxymuconolactone decarboxylase family protein n=1 Tax=Pseudomonas sp. URMO17WK12:I12 TaxID=1259797 RepID=UPI000481417B|nr:carboxymuconolactone decarboxylase family protein [Pseudomonas sp. URMO17WK12:I12]